LATVDGRESGISWRRLLYELMDKGVSVSSVNSSEIQQAMSRSSYGIFWCPTGVNTYSRQEHQYGRGNTGINYFFTNNGFAKLDQLVGQIEPITIETFPQSNSNPEQGSLAHFTRPYFDGVEMTLLSFKGDRRHGDSFNALYIDGHCASMDKTTAETIQPDVLDKTSLK
jgi:prepilin-type processing-associated H-X9-DG protein